jgi:predicted peroxiredoxin
MTTFKKQVQQLTGARLQSLSNLNAEAAAYCRETADGHTLYLMRYGNAEQLNANPIVIEDEVYTDAWQLNDLIAQAIREGLAIYVAEEIQEELDIIDSDSDFWQEIFEETKSK